MNVADWPHFTLLIDLSVILVNVSIMLFTIFSSILCYLTPEAVRNPSSPWETYNPGLPITVLCMVQPRICTLLLGSRFTTSKQAQGSSFISLRCSLFLIGPGLGRLMQSRRDEIKFCTRFLCWTPKASMCHQEFYRSDAFEYDKYKKN